MHSIEERISIISDMNPDALFVDGFEEAIIGFIQLTEEHPTIVMYDMGICLEILMDDGMTAFEAQEYFDYNLLGSYLGISTPCYLPVDFEEYESFVIVRCDGEFTPKIVGLFDEEEI